MIYLFYRIDGKKLLTCLIKTAKKVPLYYSIVNQQFVILKKKNVRFDTMAVPKK